MPTLPPEVTALEDAPDQLRELFKKYYPDAYANFTGQPREASLDEVLSGDPGFAPGMAMIPTARNLDKFRELMNKELGITSQHLPEEARQAIAYLKTRYPSMVKRARLAVNPQKSGAYFDAPGAKQPGYVSLGNMTDAYERKPLDTVFRQLATRRAGKEEPLSMYIKTLAHELTHARQNMRSPELLWEKYRPYVRSAKPVDDFLSFLDYYAQPAERLARQGGETALKGFDKFLKLTGF